MSGYLFADVTRLTKSRILDHKAIRCYRRVSLESNKQIVASGSDVRRRFASAECAQPWRRLVLPVVHCDVVESTVATVLNGKREKVQFNNLKRSSSR